LHSVQTSQHMLKKLHSLLVCTLLLAATVRAQTGGIHLATGFSNYFGDLNEQWFTLKQSQSVSSIGFWLACSPRFTLRADASFGKVQADDKKSTDRYRNKRNLNFHSNINEYSLQLEYNLVKTDPEQMPMFVPYVSTGIAFFSFNPYTYTSGGKQVFLQPLNTEGQGMEQYPNSRRYTLTQLSIPLSLGVKYYLSQSVQMGVEIGYRKAFTDYLDDVSGVYADPELLSQYRGPMAVQLAFRGDELKPNPVGFPGAGKQRGNPDNQDGYYFGQLRFSFALFNR
jgi:hypothetical protein